MSKGLLDGWRFRTAKTGEGGIYCVAETDNPSFREPRWVYTGAIRMSEAEALADLEAFKPVAEAMELVRRGGPGMEEMRQRFSYLIAAVRDYTTPHSDGCECELCLELYETNDLLACYDAAVNVGKGE